MKFIRNLIILIILLIIAGGIWIWSGSYNIGADSPHWKITSRVIHELREHSIDKRADAIQVPNLDDPALISEGASHYAEMCTGCHLAPGLSKTEIRQGLYPHPPNLTRFAPDPAEAFWVIKHGIKMSGMPAWGTTHSDQKIWAMVAYLQKQPHMSVDHYQQLVQPAEHEHATLIMPDAMSMPASPSSVPAAAASASHP
ncbi:MAG: cytochrome c [Xanthomonadales bacterium]|nr:cytochrome c [Xanthomonadales bacterium]